MKLSDKIYWLGWPFIFLSLVNDMRLGVFPNVTNLFIPIMGVVIVTIGIFATVFEN